MHALLINLSRVSDADVDVRFPLLRLLMFHLVLLRSDYAYDNVTNDTTLEHFDHSLTRDNEYVLPLLRRAAAATVRPLRLFSAPWSPPAWMKLGFPPGAPPAMDVSAPDGLVPEFRPAWAKYFSLWHSALKQQIAGAGNATVWGFSPQNEPLAHGHMWDCLGYSVQSYVAFLRDNLIPTMRADHPDLELLIFDHNPDAVYDWVAAAYNDSFVRDAVWGTAVHWYSDEGQRGVQVNRTHALAPDKRILHTEGCNCGGVTMPSDPGWWARGEKYGVGLLQYLQVRNQR
jgi:glucosylceramidase